jgi:hypothetical protein
MGELFTPVHLILIIFIALSMAAWMIVPYWQIFTKAGFPGPLALLMIVPFANIVVLYIVAFSRWKTVADVTYLTAPYPPAAQYPPQQAAADLARIYPASAASCLL